MIMGDSAVANGGESGLQDDQILVFEPVVSRPDAARVVESGDALPWPVVGAPFALDGMAEVIGVFLAGSAWAVHAPPFLRIGPHPVDVPDSLVLDALAERDSAVHAFAAWQTFALDEKIAASASSAWLARLLTMMSWVLYPSTSEAPLRDPNFLRVSAAQANSVCAIIPGGNLHGLVTCAWALSRHLAVALLAAIDDKDVAAVFAVPSSERVLMPEAVRAALYGVVPVPGIDLGKLLLTPGAGWHLDREVFGTPYAWGRQSLARAVGQVALGYKRVVDPSGGGFAMLSYPPNKRWVGRALPNFHTYTDMSRVLLETTCWVLRMVLHIAYRIYRHFDRASPYIARPTRWRTQLRTIIETDPQAVSDSIFRLARESGVPFEWFWESERRFEASVREQGQMALTFAWGMVPHAQDSLDRCMACIPVDDVTVPSQMAMC